jgi:hypothetical protein
MEVTCCMSLLFIEQLVLFFFLLLEALLELCYQTLLLMWRYMIPIMLLLIFIMFYLWGQCSLCSVDFSIGFLYFTVIVFTSGEVRLIFLLYSSV